jgi:hypothetical protein
MLRSSVSCYPSLILFEESRGMGSDGGTARAPGNTTRVVEPPNLMPPKHTRLPLDTKYPRESTILRDFVENTLGENSKIHIFQQDHK